MLLPLSARRLLLAGAALWRRFVPLRARGNDAQSRFGGRFARHAPIAQCRIDSLFRIRLNRLFPVHYSLFSIGLFLQAALGSVRGRLYVFSTSISAFRCQSGGTWRAGPTLPRFGRCRSPPRPAATCRASGARGGIEDPGLPVPQAGPQRYPGRLMRRQAAVGPIARPGLRF